MNRLLHKLLYKLLPLRTYLVVVSGILFLLQRLGWGRRNPMVEYIYHLERLIGKGGVAIDIGANLGYYSRPLSSIVGAEGKVYAVEPVPPIFEVLRFNLRHCHNVETMNIALGEENMTVKMANDSVATQGYFGTGQNFVQRDETKNQVVEFDAVMQRGSQIFASLQRLDLIKCDIEGYEDVVLGEMLPIIERFRPVVLLESGGENRAKMVALFRGLEYECFTLCDGTEREFDFATDNGKDLIFRPLEQ